MTKEQEVIRARWGYRCWPSSREMPGNRMMGNSHDSFHPLKELYEKGRELALHEVSRRKPVLKNRVAPEIKGAIVGLAIEQPAYGQVRVSNERAKRGASAYIAGSQP